MLARVRSCFLLSFLFVFSMVPYQSVHAQINPAYPATSQRKKIKDPAECKLYISAVQQIDAAAKIGSLEAFLIRYPDSVMKEDALELLMGAYQQAGNQTKVVETAQNILQVNACNLRALAVLAFTKQAMATAGQNAQQNLTDAAQAAERGWQCLQTAAKPDGTSAADWKKLKSQATVIFNGADGMSAYQAKDYAKAEQHLRAAVEADPTNLADVYDLALAYLAPGPAEKDVDGLFFIARASNLQQGASKDAIAKYGKSKYNKYHGTDEGWSDVLALTATAATPPPTFTIAKYAPPTLAEHEAAPVQTKKTEMSFRERPTHTLSIDPPSKTVDAQAKSIDVPAKLRLGGSSNGVPPAVTSIGFGGKPPTGARPRAPFHGPNSGRYFWGGCCFTIGVIEPVYVPYAVPYAPEDDDGALDVDAPEQQNADLEFNGAGDLDSTPEVDAYDQSEDPVADQSEDPVADQSEDPVADQPSTVLVFKDGHRSEVLNYAIVGDTLFDFDLADGRTRKILLADLDLPATHKANDDRGVDFQIPASVNRK